MELPARIGKYELEEFLGGGMSHVYRARDTVIGRTVAVKILTDAACQDAEAKARFLAEARMAGGISHDNVISIFDFGEDEQHRPFMVMEFLRGEDLRHAIKNGHTGDLSDKLKIALQVARSLEFIHTQKIIHRDIKPENIHITTSGAVKLMDFGIAKAQGLAMTRAGYVLGTPYYMAPEQVTGQNITEQVDVYAFGVLLFELLTGVKPISADTVERIFFSILNDPLNLQPLHDAGIPQPVCDLVASCTAKDPAARPQGFAPVIAAIDQFLGEMAAPTVAIRTPTAEALAAVKTKSAAKPKPPSSPVKKWLIPILTVVLVSLAIGYYVVLKPGSHRGEPAKPVELAPTIATSTGDMVLVAKGAFLFGEKKESVDLPAFYIDKTEVTNAAYQRFCQASGRPLPDGFAKDKPEYPIVGITIIDARAFATWAGKRLPTSQEWEKAARGADGRMFPWGDQPDAKRCNVDTKKVRPVADLPESASPCGALNMIGNVWEFVDQEVKPSDTTVDNFRPLMKPPLTPDERWFPIRGGSFRQPLAATVIWDQATVPARWKKDDIGFRCVMTPK